MEIGISKMKILRFPKGAYIDDAICLIPISEFEKIIILLVLHQIDLPYLYQPYIKDNPIIGESIIGSKEKTTNKYGTFFMNINTHKIFENILDYEIENFEKILYNDPGILELFEENKKLYIEYLERNKK